MSRTRRVARFLSLTALAAIGVIAPKSAAAYQLKHTTAGVEMRWHEATVDFAISPTLVGIAHANDVVPSILSSWSQASVPFLRAVKGSATDQPGYDGKNIV